MADPSETTTGFRRYAITVIFWILKGWWSVRDDLLKPGRHAAGAGNPIERVTIETTVAVDIEEGEAGGWYASSPMVKGLLLFGHSRDELLARIPGAIRELTAANMDPEIIALQRVANASGTGRA
jgi:predicted RNase H-like HicB family nuclease